MAQHSSSKTNEPWTERAIQYAQEYGWLIVPLQANMESSPSYSDDPVEKQLNCFVHVDYPENATSDPEAIRSLGTQFPVALIGAVTGRASDLIAVEVEHPRTEPSSVRERIEDIASETLRVLGTNREYILFRPPETAHSIPRLSRKEGVVLHGEESVIRLPWRYYKWSFDSGPVQRADETLLSLFGEETKTSSVPHQTSVSHNGHADSEPDEEQPADTLPVRSQREQKLASPHQASLFRSGDALRLRADERACLDLPWIVPGGFSLFTAPSKVGASSWSVNLAAHVAAGHSFLETDAQRGEVVMLADTSPSNFRRLLERMDVLQTEDLSRLHVLHARDVSNLDWRSTLQRTYRRVEEVGADLVVIDCLDRYVRLKGGGIPTAEEDVAHVLTAEAPSECSILAVQSSDCDAREPIARTARRLGLLGRAADSILRLDDVSNTSFPTLRRLLTISRTGSVPEATYCALRQGRYERIRQSGDGSRVQSERDAASHDQIVSTPGFESLPT